MEGGSAGVRGAQLGPRVAVHDRHARLLPRPRNGGAGAPFEEGLRGVPPSESPGGRATKSARASSSPTSSRCSSCRPPSAPRCCCARCSGFSARETADGARHVGRRGQQRAAAGAGEARRRAPGPIPAGHAVRTGRRAVARARRSLRRRLEPRRRARDRRAAERRRSPHDAAAARPSWGRPPRHRRLPRPSRSSTPRRGASRSRHTNGQPALLGHRARPRGVLTVITFADEQIAALTAFFRRPR